MEHLYSIAEKARIDFVANVRILTGCKLRSNIPLLQRPMLVQITC